MRVETDVLLVSLLISSLLVITGWWVRQLRRDLSGASWENSGEVSPMENVTPLDSASLHARLDTLRADFIAALPGSDETQRREELLEEARRAIAHRAYFQQRRAAWC